VWNGGCPPVLLLGEGADILHRFHSRHLPLGVVAADEFDAGLEYFKVVDQAASLLMCSDGATEIDMGNGEGLGQAGLLAGTQSSSGETLFDRVQDVINGHLGGGPPLDDIALIMVDVPVIDQLASEIVLSRTKECLPGERVAGCGHGIEQSLWKFSLMLTAQQLKHLDVVPFLLNIAGQIEGGRADGKLFLVLSELFNNALDHGLLKLDSTLKNEIDGMETYFVERAARLAELELGQIFIRLDKLSCGCLKVSMKDSGDGFNFLELADIKRNVQRHGRGIALLDNMCSALQYSGNGSEVAAYVGVANSVAA